jgi:hypothetical protein
VIKGLGLTESGLRRIIAANAPGRLTLQDWDNNLDGYARYVARNGEVVRVKRAKKALKASSSSFVARRCVGPERRAR